MNNNILKNILFILIGIVIGFIIWFGWNLITKEEPIEEKQEEVTNIQEEEDEPDPIPEGAPDIIGIYTTNQGSSNRILVEDEFTAPWIRGTDINTFNAVYSNEPLLEGSSVKDIWTKNLVNYPNAEGYKIGYELTFVVEDGTTYTKNILSPKDTEEYFKYIEIYLYDSYHVTPGVWYSHLLETEITDETIITSIKLTPGTSINDVTDISLMAFVYQDNKDFDEETDKYNGQVSYKINIIKE